jgi:hypothetical protein
MQKLSQSEVWVKQVKSQLVKGHVKDSKFDKQHPSGDDMWYHKVMISGKGS